MKDDPFAPRPLSPAEPEDAEERLLRGYERALRGVIPPLVHKLNNLITRAMGSMDRVGEGEEGLSEISDPLFELTHRLQRLTQFSRGQGNAQRIAELFEGLELLVGPVGSDKGVRFECLPLVRGSLDPETSLEPMLVLLVARELMLTANDTGLNPRDRRVRLRAEREDGGRARFWLSSPRSCLETSEADALCIATLAAASAPKGILVRDRAFGSIRTTLVSAPVQIETSIVRNSPSERILLLEADPIDRELLAEVISEDGYRVTVAANGSEAEKCLADRTFDLLLVNGAELGQDPNLVQPSRKAAFSSDGGVIGIYGGPPASGTNVHHYDGKLLAKPLIEFVRLCLSEKKKP